MNQRLRDLLKEWALRAEESESEIFFDHSMVHYLGRTVFDDYEPSSFDPFVNRLDRWLHNVSDEKDQQTLFRLLDFLFFVGRAEFEALCRTAYTGHIFRWLVDQIGIDIASPDAILTLNNSVARTWFCPITDSMRINSFLKINNLPGKNYQPDWRSLKKFSDPEKIRKFVAKQHIQQLVLLEDFVGSGTQMQNTIKFAAKTLPNVKILALPMIACPVGNEVGSQLAEDFPNVSYMSVMDIAPEMLVKAVPQPSEPQFFKTVRSLITQISGKLSAPESDVESQRYHGFKGTGAVVAMYSNCPNNSLPIIYDETMEWHALFPRIERT